MKLRSTACLVFCVFLASCTTVPKEWVATGGSRSDGVIRLSYEQSELEQAQVTESQGIALAVERCKVWGYTGADAFGGTTRRCNLSGGFSGCRQWMVTKEYQCTGQGTAAKP